MRLVTGFVVAKRGEKFFTNVSPYINELRGDNIEMRWFAAYNTFLNEHHIGLGDFPDLKSAIEDCEIFRRGDESIPLIGIEIDEVKKEVRELKLAA